MDRQKRLVHYISVNYVFNSQHCNDDIQQTYKDGSPNFQISD